jgi:hypothetical protein
MLRRLDDHDAAGPAPAVSGSTVVFSPVALKKPDELRTGDSLGDLDLDALVVRRGVM